MKLGLRLRRAACMAGVAAALATATVTAGPLTGPQAAAAEPEFRYWTYWTGSGDRWDFAAVGPAFRDAEEGVVEGWRLAVTGVTAQVPPRTTPADALRRACAEVPPAPERIRVAIVIDFGLPQDAPDGESPPASQWLCAQVEPGQTGFDALRATASIRSERGLVCGLGGYPSRGCAERVERTSAAGSDAGPDSGSSNADPRAQEPEGSSGQQAPAPSLSTAPADPSQVDQSPQPTPGSRPTAGRSDPPPAPSAGSDRAETTGDAPGRGSEASPGPAGTPPASTPPAGAVNAEAAAGYSGQGWTGVVALAVIAGLAVGAWWRFRTR